MADISTANFPKDPTVGDKFQYGGQEWTWDGYAWTKSEIQEISWDEVLNKPATFPASPHTHPESEITDLNKYTRAEVDQMVADINAAHVTAMNDLTAYVDQQDTALASDYNGKINIVAQDLATHAARVDNPHQITWTQVGDKPATFPATAHTHTEAQITDLNRIRWRGAWVAGTYIQNDVVQDGEYLFVATAATTTERPGNDTGAPPTPADWDMLVAGGSSSVHVSDTAPSFPQLGDLWYCSVEPEGLFVYYDDGTSQQWVQV